MWTTPGSVDEKFTREVWNMAKGQPSVWFPEAVQIVQEHWGVFTPWEIAREVNRFLAQRVIPSLTVDDHLECDFTSPRGGGVVWKAWELGLVDNLEDRDRIRKATAKGSTPYLSTKWPSRGALNAT